MSELTRSQKARVAIRSFKTGVDAIGLRGYYRPKDLIGQALADSLRTLSPEIYGSMNDPRVVELKGLEYVIDRLPRGIERSTRIILTEEGGFEGTNFEKIEPPKRRRISFMVSATEMCFVITRGLSEIYDIMTHLTFLTIEARKIQERMRDESGHLTVEWKELEKIVQAPPPSGGELDQALWNLSILLGRTFQETRETFESLETGRKECNSNAGLFALIYHLGRRVDEEKQSPEDALIVYLTPSLMNSIGHHKYGKPWASDIKAKLVELGLAERPLHIISANLHSVVNLLYGPAALAAEGDKAGMGDVVSMVCRLIEQKTDVCAIGATAGLVPLPDRSGTHVDCQIIDTALLGPDMAHSDLCMAPLREAAVKPVILVMDYAFGVQAFELMENLLYPHWEDDRKRLLNIRSIAVMGKAGILTGKKGEIMLATAHVIEGTTDNYTVPNDLVPEDFGSEIPIHTGPMLTVVGTSLQNRDVLYRIQRGWKAVGLEMEGGHYQRAINAAIIKGNIPPETKTRYAYYASDNPLKSGQTLASGPMGQDGLAPTYLITKVLLEKILADPG
ncbi:MAG: hypothetical protein KQI78_11525 [Deltaproteobacteria bacterium]|jgi:hypothetical protein|nr:hypothetical protein [Deltaproteobacteria bacterium]